MKQTIRDEHARMIRFARRQGWRLYKLRVGDEVPRGWRYLCLNYVYFQ